MNKNIKWANALSTRSSLEGAVTEVVEQVTQSLSELPDIGFVFISSAYASDYPRLVPLILEKLPLPILIGCGAGGVIGMKNPAHAVEIEANPALSLTVAKMKQVQIQPFYLSGEILPDLDSPPDAWVELIGVEPTKSPQFILLSDPFNSRINDLLEGLDYAYPLSPKVGGLASSSIMGLQSALFYHAPNHLEDSLYRQGTIGVALSGDILLETIVAQGCRPIGQPYRVSQGERNIIIQLTNMADDSDSRPPLEVLQDLVQSLSEPERELAQTSLFIGVVSDEFKLNLQPGDFLIRNLLGVDPRHGAIAIGDRVRLGQRVQFHLRDAQTSAQDLETLLKTYQEQHSKEQQEKTRGALLFSCLGRGETLYGKPNFDSSLFQRYLRYLPLGGFFCNGEIGPVSQRTFLHGYTSAFAIFSEL